MRVFVTGATGHIGSLVVAELLDSGHEVSGLARSDKSAAALTAAGAQVHRGTLDDLDSLRAAAAAANGVIHLAFIHDFSNSAAPVATDLRAIEAIGAVLEGSGKPFVVTSGTAGLSPGRLGTEEDIPGVDFPRGPAEYTAITLAERGVRSSVVRLAPSVHGPADHHGFIPTLINVAREKGVSAYVGDGPTGGQPCTNSMRHVSSAWPWKRHRQAHGYTASATRACLSETSLRSSAVA